MSISIVRKPPRRPVAMSSDSHSSGTTTVLVLPLLICLLNAAAAALAQGTRVGFYGLSCSAAEDIVRSAVETHYGDDPTVAPGLLRMHFHDCFVRGCDASILIGGASAERTALPNLGLRVYEVIDDAKAQLEAACPGVVSCADILALAARDSVALTGGPWWQVPTGRRDGLVSSASDAGNLPSFTDSVDVQKQKFAEKGLNTKDLVTLLGGHTIGTAQCQFFSYRLYNFTEGNPDPTISSSYFQQLRLLCPAGGDGSNRVDLDDGSGGDFDNNYFYNLEMGKGLLESDQVLFSDFTTRRYVRGYTGLLARLLGTFPTEFARSMVKMSNIGVNTGSDGEIRMLCSAVN
ncbi:hypothetical protein Taro_052460 [Colocasia esculenta]|uniref:Peroxidase n=1 Tax=Colocasia esculenta TaxID=4460 RepID=A0A843XK46_COLES|nr:hypothetical protein [Colocasia esculenta]